MFVRGISVQQSALFVVDRVVSHLLSQAGFWGGPLLPVGTMGGEERGGGLVLVLPLSPSA